MATRATYKIETMTFYGHWDGYPAGAAARFSKMIEALTQPETGGGVEAIRRANGGLAFAFIRGNLDIEPTASHLDHGDTDFHYELRTDSDKSVIVDQWQRINGADGWKLRFRKSQPLEVFIDTARGEYVAHMTNYYDRNKIDFDPDEFKAEAAAWIKPALKIEETQTYGPDLVFYATTTAGKAIMQTLYRKARRFKTGNPNRDIYRNRARQWRAQLNDLKPAA